MKYMTLREEDHQLLLQLHDFVYLHKDFIEKYIYTKYTGSHSIYRRLSKLAEAGYIKPFLLPINHSDHRPSNVYTLTRFGVETVEQLRGVVHWNAQWSSQPPPWYQHQLMLAESVKSYELEAGNIGLEVKQWISEARAFFEFPAINSANKQKAQIRPDGILNIGAKGSEKSMGLMLEMERSYTSKERTIRKIDQFNEFFSRKGELMDDYLRKVAFETEVTGFKIIFIGGTEAKANKLLRDLEGESSHVPVLVASKEAILREPFAAIYRDIRDPEKYTIL